MSAGLDARETVRHQGKTTIGRTFSMRRFAVFIFIFFLVFCLHAMVGTRAADAAGSCVTATCHSAMGKGKFIHGPVAVGNCTVCHISVGNHKFATIKKASDFCYKCHDRLNTKSAVHVPVKNGDCTLCHDPHQSPYKYQLRADVTKICFNCHDKKIASGKYVHGPVSVGGCIMCHNPHQSDFPHMLNASGNAVCFQCHTDMADTLKGDKFVHEAVKEGCINCHSPHSADYPHNLKADGSEALCFGCHTDKKDWVANVKTKHGALQSGRKCLACHDPHGSGYPKQLVKAPMDLCLSCHDKPLDTPNGKLIDMKTYLAENKEKHGPVREKDCSACHNPHGSNNFRILRKYFPPVFYAPFDPKNYDLCFSCHEKTLVLDPRTTTLTNFRNGDINLHYLHVNKPVKGRTCRACHEMHATNNPKHIRDAVPFGVWQLPLNYRKTPDGGSCQPGCHQRFSYDRKSPVKNR
jgi:predicted CXXCH cytochrome family protein